MPAHLYNALQRRVVKTIGWLDARALLGGLVDLPRLRRELADVPRDQLDLALLELHGKGVVELHIAQNPLGVDEAQGIWLESGTPHARLAYYVSLRPVQASPTRKPRKALTGSKKGARGR